MKRPSFQFYPADWRKDAALQSCSLESQGLWINIMCIAHECEPYGYLVVNGKPMNPAQIGRLVGVSQKEANALITELQDAGVLSISEDGAIFSRRMVRDEAVRNARAAGGKDGAEHGKKGAEFGKNGGRPKKETGDKNPPSTDEETVDKKPPLEPPPSSSSSTSVSSEAKASGGEPPKITDPDEIIFSYGVPLLTNAGASDKHARSFLGGLRKMHGDQALIDKLRDCIREKPLQPLEWLAAALPPIGQAKAGSRHAGFDKIDYRAGVTADGRF